MFNIQDVPLEIWQKIASYAEIDNKIARLCKNTHQLTFSDLSNIKKIFDQLSDLQIFYYYKAPCNDPLPIEFSKRTLIGNFINNELKIQASDEDEESSNMDKVLACDIHIQPYLGKTQLFFLREDNLENGYLSYLRSIMPTTFNGVCTYEAQIRNIYVTKMNHLSPERQLVIEKATQYANIFYANIRKMKEVSSLSLF